MPTMNFHSSFEAAFLPFEVAAYMLYPSDEKLRNAFLAQKMADFALHCSIEDELESVPIDILKDLLENPEKSGMDTIEKFVIRGSIAGEILLYLIKLSVSNEDPSVGMAIHLGTHYFSGVKNTSGRRIASSKRTIWRIWSNYKSVAHFWAALQLHFQSTFDLSNPSDSDSLLQLLSLANELGELARTLESKRSKEAAYAQDELWSLPYFIELSGCEFRCHGLNEQERVWMRNYTALSPNKNENL